MADGKRRAPGRRELCVGVAAAAPLWAAGGCASRAGQGNATVVAAAAAGPAAAAGAPIRLLARGDDMGSSHGSNVGSIRSYREGIVRSVEVIVPGPWFPEAVQMLRDHPGLDVGVHLCLTSEWENIKWRPLTPARTLVDGDGYLLPTVYRRPGHPANTALKEVAFDLGEVERELRAQIELLRKHIPRTSHVSGHMGATGATPELSALTARLVEEYGLGAGAAKLRRLPVEEVKGAARGDAGAREQALLAGLAAVGPGDYLFVEHPATDDPELRAHGHVGYLDVAAERGAATKALTSPAVMELVRSRGITLVGYPEVRGGHQR